MIFGTDLLAVMTGLEYECGGPRLKKLKVLCRHQVLGSEETLAEYNAHMAHMSR